LNLSKFAIENKLHALKFTKKTHESSYEVGTIEDLEFVLSTLFGLPA